MQPAPVRPTKAYPKLCAEAASLTTAPARLVALSQRDAPMGPLALRNPQLPAVRLVEALRLGKPAAWDNPAAPFALWDLPAEHVRAGAVACGLELARLRKEGKPYPVTDAMRGLLRGPMAAAWERPPAQYLVWSQGVTTSPVSPAAEMMTGLSTYALYRGPLGPVHRQATLVFCLLVRSLAKSDTGAIWSRAHRPDRVVSKVEEMAWAAAPAHEVSDFQTTHRHLSISDSVGALVFFAMVPMLPGWDGGGVGSVWAKAPDGFEDVIRAALPEAPWLAELA